MNDLLHISDLHCGYNTRPVLNGVTLSLKRGETVLLAGPNGCGKSTLLKAVIGMLPPARGTITFDGNELRHTPVERRVNLGMGYLSQTRNTFPELGVRENLELACWALSNKERKDAIDDILSIFDFLKPMYDKNHRTGSLSTGQHQALAIAMVLVHRDKKLYLLDEPTAGLSHKAANDIITRIRQFTATRPHCAVLMVEHRLELLKWVNRAIVLIQGAIQADTSDTSLLLDLGWLSKHYF